MTPPYASAVELSHSIRSSARRTAAIWGTLSPSTSPPPPVPLHQSPSIAGGGHPAVGEGKRVQGNETMTALPPRSPTDVSRTSVTWDPPSQDAVDRVAPIKGNSIVSEVENLPHQPRRKSKSKSKSSNRPNPSSNPKSF